MVKNKATLRIALRQNNNEDSKAYGKWYPEIDQSETISMRGLCDHMESHGSLYTRETIEAVIRKLVGCIPELAQQGIGVKLEGLGIFYPSVESDGVDKPADYKVTKHVKAVHLRFRPDSTDLDNLTSRAFMKQCAVEVANVITTTGTGKTLKKTRTPFSLYTA